MPAIRAAAVDGQSGAIRDLNVFRHRLLQLIGSKAASLGGVNLLAFTGEVYDSQLHWELKAELAQWEEFTTVVIPSNEEEMIARLFQRHSETPALAAVG